MKKLLSIMLFSLIILGSACNSLTNGSRLHRPDEFTCWTTHDVTAGESLNGIALKSQPKNHWAKMRLEAWIKRIQQTNPGLTVPLGIGQILKIPSLDLRADQPAGVQTGIICPTGH